ncbi:hypothetical protein BDP81DRAFT_220070 [Colletotrichum phormii]|uniref:Uncharacterized protein n=1 Tax=Colletotrichum phormii TaxID=359342 RepID=A0AAI9ZS66_9PEZI|nr:uncharacterized protein BDP81DRAFT_220070 [Colletotrichum phormii]KAK1637189.1 hypothetical protein BDP81DRAFT_220070 [Colletotrichum phormii]
MVFNLQGAWDMCGERGRRLTSVGCLTLRSSFPRVGSLSFFSLSPALILSFSKFPLNSFGTLVRNSHTVYTSYSGIHAQVLTD